ncbi:MBL fold metallo-hydrolase [Candidatus Woesearchaeota archaeon]|nr:MBL fold metallo-hydrolase [Candidatus Woesearchaeota archaeon]
MARKTKLSKEVEKELGFEPKEHPKPKVVKHKPKKEKPEKKTEIKISKGKKSIPEFKLPKFINLRNGLTLLTIVLLILLISFAWYSFRPGAEEENETTNETIAEENETIEEVVTEENETVEEENETIEVVTEDNLTTNETVNEENETVEEIEEEINITPGDPLKVYFMNVLGDGIVIVMPNEKVLVIDGGSEETDSQLIYFMRRDLDLWEIHGLVATHPDEEHIAALKSVIFNFNIKPQHTTTYDTNLTTETGIFKTYKALAEQQTTIEVVKNNTEIDIDDDLEITIFSPYTEGYNKEFDDNCLVTKLVYKNVSFLFTSDCGLICQENIMENNIKAKILQIQSHGMINESFEDFFDEVDPEIAVVSNWGRGNLTEEALDVMDNADVYQTKENIVLIETDGASYNITQELSI